MEQVLGPEHPNILTSRDALAWLLATCPDAKIRNSHKAVELAIRVCERLWWSWPGDWCVSSPIINRSSNGEKRCEKEPWPRERHAKKPSWPWRANCPLICGVSVLGGSAPSRSD